VLVNVAGDGDVDVDDTGYFGHDQHVRVVAFATATLLVTLSVGAAETPPKQRKPRCTRVVASTVPASELEVVGSVASHRTAKILVMDTHKKGYIVGAGECAGRERLPFDKLRRTPAGDAPAAESPVVITTTAR
jgi:hypothetical protein